MRYSEEWAKNQENLLGFDFYYKRVFFIFFQKKNIRSVLRVIRNLINIFKKNTQSKRWMYTLLSLVKRNFYAKTLLPPLNATSIYVMWFYSSSSSSLKKNGDDASKNFTSK